ncbi:uncharacterized protein LOC143026587 [Oratosquilla oratoria]|uniref:uncharacterized protein LOC143026587 n=1 Tax=Oratosquilla oratoria TaxID=337810 RepID=UPI003F777E56
MGNTEGSLSQLEVQRDNGQVFEDWTMAPGELSGQPVTVFSASHPPTSRKRPYIERALQASKVYRHPGLLKYIDGGDVGGEIIVVTERVSPLLHMNLSKMSPLHVSTGLASIVETLIFLHDRAGVSHNNVSPASIFVNSEGTWKLWGLEYSCSFGDLTQDHIERISSYCHEKSIPPDDKSRISPSYQHARDCFAFAKLVEQVLLPQVLEELPAAPDFLNVMRATAQHKDWTKRPRLSVLAAHQFFSHDFLQLYHNLTNILLMADDQRDLFLKDLAENLRKYPEDLVAGTMVGALLSRPVLMHPSAATQLLPALLTPKTASGEKTDIGLFSKSVYAAHVIPPLLKLFSVHDATVRCILLKYLPHYVSLIKQDILAEVVLPELLLGIRDINDALVAATLHGLACLVPLLGANTVIGSNRQVIFATAKPKALSRRQAQDVMLLRSVPTRPVNTFTKSEVTLQVTSEVRIPSISDADVRSLDNISIDSIATSQIPERSSPDGGEGDELSTPATNQDVSKTSHSLQDSTVDIQPETQEDWSDWEEMQDEVTDFHGALLTLTTADGNVLANGEEDDAHWRMEDVSKEEHDHIKGEKGKSKFSDLKEETKLPVLSVKEGKGKNGSAMKLVGQTTNKPKTSPHTAIVKNNVPLGEEFDVLAIKVKKKRDKELDLFAELTPTLETKKFDLESMLTEAKSSMEENSRRMELSEAKIAESLSRSPSVSSAFAALEVDGSMEGDGWGEDSWGNEELDMGSTIETVQETNASSEGLKEGTLNMEMTTTDTTLEENVKDGLDMITSNGKELAEVIAYHLEELDSSKGAITSTKEIDTLGPSGAWNDDGWENGSF